MRTKFAFVVLLVACLCCAIQAQTITATITGTVTDATGAVVPNSQVVTTNTGTRPADSLWLVRVS